MNLNDLPQHLKDDLESVSMDDLEAGARICNKLLFEERTPFLGVMISGESDAFTAETFEAEMTRILREIADRMERGDCLMVLGETRRLLDLNGNDCGWYKLSLIEARLANRLIQGSEEGTEDDEEERRSESSPGF